MSVARKGASASKHRQVRNAKKNVILNQLICLEFHFSTNKSSSSLM